MLSYVQNSTTAVGSQLLPLSSQGYNNFIGVAQNTAASGTVVTVDTPCSINKSQQNLTTGLFYYLDTASSGITTVSGSAQGWTNGNVIAPYWLPAGKAVSSSGILVLNTI